MEPTPTLERDVASLVPEWSALAERTGAAPFAHPDWVLAWWEAFGRGRPVALVLRRGEELAGVLPLEQRLGALHAPANWHTPQFGPLAIDDDARHLLFEAAFRSDRRAVGLSMLDVDRGDLDVATRFAAAAGRTSASAVVQHSPYVLVDGDWDGYRRRLHRGRRREVQRQWRRLRELGDVTVDVVTEVEQLRAAWREALRVEASGWKGRSGTAIASHARTRRFYGDLTHAAATRGWLRLALLRVDGRAVACDVALEHDGVWYALKGGYDESLRSYAPGVLLLHAELERAFERGLRRFELLGDAEPYKLAWADGCGERAWLRSYRSSGYGRAAATALRGREQVRPLARVVRRRLLGRPHAGPAAVRGGLT